MGPLISLFWALRLKASVNSLLTWFISCIQWIPQIHLWCGTCWPIDGQHGSWAFLSHIFSHECGAKRALKPSELGWNTYVCDLRNVTFCPWAAAISSPSADREMFGTDGNSTFFTSVLLATSQILEIQPKFVLMFLSIVKQIYYTGSRLQRVQRGKKLLLVSGRSF